MPTGKSTHIKEKAFFLSVRAMRRLGVGVLIILIFLALYFGAWRLIWPRDANEQVRTTLASLASAVYIYQQDNEEGILPEPMGELRFYNQYGQPVEVGSQEAYFVTGQIRPGFLPEEYMPEFSVDPRSDNYYRYSRTLDNSYFQLAGVIFDDDKPESLVEGNFTDDFALTSLIPDYQSHNFVTQRSRDYFPYNPYTYEEIADIKALTQLSNAVRPLVNLVSVDNEKTKIELRVPWKQKFDLDGFIIYLNGERIKTTETSIPIIILNEPLKGELQIYGYFEKLFSAPSVPLQIGQGILQPGITLYAGDLDYIPKCGNGAIDEGELCDGSLLGEAPLHGICNFDCKSYGCQLGYELVEDECELIDQTPPLVYIEVPSEWTQSAVQVVLHCSDNVECDLDSYRFAKVEGVSSECPKDYMLYDVMLEGDSKFFDDYAILCAAAKDVVGSVGFSELAVEVPIDTDKPLAEVTITPYPYTIADKDKPLTISIEAADDHGEVEEIYYSIAPQIDPYNYGQLYETPFEVADETIVYVAVVDRVGNRSPTMKYHVCGKNQVFIEDRNLCIPLEKINICANALMPDQTKAKWIKPLGVDERTGEYDAYYDSNLQAYVPLESDCEWICIGADTYRQGFECAANKREVDCNEIPGVRPKPAIASWVNPLDVEGNEVQMSPDGRFISVWNEEENNFDPLVDRSSCQWTCPEGFHAAHLGEQCEINIFEADCKNYALPKPPTKGEYMWLKPLKSDGAEVDISEDGRYTAVWDDNLGSFDPMPNIDNCRWACPDGMELNTEGSECVLKQRAPEPVPLRDGYVRFNCHDYSDPPPPEGFDVTWLKPRKYDGTLVPISDSGNFETSVNEDLGLYDPPASASNCVWVCPDDSHRTADNSCAYDITTYNCNDFVVAPEELDTDWEDIVMEDGTIIPVGEDGTFEAVWDDLWQRYEPDPNNDSICQWKCAGGFVYGEGECIDEHYLFSLTFDTEIIEPSYSRFELETESSPIISSGNYRFVPGQENEGIKIEPQGYLLYAAQHNFNPTEGTIELRVKLEDLRGTTADPFNPAPGQYLIDVAKINQRFFSLTTTLNGQLKVSIWDELNLSRAIQFDIPEGEGWVKIKVQWSEDIFELKLTDADGESIVPELVETVDTGGGVYESLPSDDVIIYIGTDSGYSERYQGVIDGVKIYGEIR